MNRVLWNFSILVVAFAMVCAGAKAELAQTGERMVNTQTQHNQLEPSVASDAAGNFVVVWEGYYQKNGSSYSNIYGQRFDAAGTPLGSEFLINALTNSQHLKPVIAMDVDGDFVVSWHSSRNEPSYDIIARRYNAAGEPLGSEFVVNTYTTGAQEYSAVAMSAAGDFVIVWTSYGQAGGTGTSGIYGQRYDTHGERVGGEFRVNTTTDGYRFFPAVAMGPHGAFVVAWQKAHSTVLARRYSADGVAQGGESTVGAGTSAAAGMDAEGNFVIAWADLFQDGDGYGIIAQRYNALGSAKGGVFRVNTYTVNEQSSPAIAMKPSGDFVTVWHSYGQDGDHYGVYAQRFLADGAPSDGEFRVNTTTANGQFISRNQSVDVDAKGNLVVAWTSYSGNPTASYDSYVTKFLVPPKKPTITTQAVTGISATTATLNASVNPGGAATTVEFFQISQDGKTSLGTVDVPAGETEVIVTKALEWLFPHTAYSVQAVATNSEGPTEGNTVGFATINRPPVVQHDYVTYAGAPLVIKPLANDTDYDSDKLTIEYANTWEGTVIRDGNTLTFTPDARFDGATIISYTVSDGRVPVAGKIFVSSAIPITRSLMATGKPVSVDTPNYPGWIFFQGSAWSGFGQPSLMDAGHSIGWLGSATTPHGPVTGIFSGSQTSPQVLRVMVGDVACDSSGNELSGLTFGSFRDPVFGQDGSGKGNRYAFQARLNGPGVTKANDDGVWVSGSQRPLLVAREGEEAQGVTGGRFASFVSLAMPNGSGVFLVATLQRKGRITAANDLGLWTWTDAQGLRLVLREGVLAEVDGEEQQVKSFKILTSVPGSAGHSRASAQQSLVYGLITFANGKQAAVSIDEEGVIEPHALTHVQRSKGTTPEKHPTGVVPVKFGIPDMAPEDLKPIVVATLMNVFGGVTPGSNLAILDYGGGVVAQKGKPAPGMEQARFRSFKDPVIGLDADNHTISAFVATVTGVSKAAGRTGVWLYSQHEETVKLVTREGAPAPGTDGSFASFQSLTMVPKYGPLFTATLRRQGKTITAANDLGLWATDSTGALCLLAREGAELIVGRTPKVLKRFDVLQSAIGSPGQGRATSPGDTKGQVIYRAEFVGGSEEIVCVTIP